MTAKPCAPKMTEVPRKQAMRHYGRRGSLTRQVDPEKELKPLCRPSAKAVALADAPAMSHLMIDGAGLRKDAPGQGKTVIRQPLAK